VTHETSDGPTPEEDDAKNHPPEAISHEEYLKEYPGDESEEYPEAKYEKYEEEPSG
jgi:hypothetical protein